MNARQIAARHFAAALAEGATEGADPDAVGRYMLAEVVRAFLTRRTADDVRAELIAAADNLDPERDYMFMRP